MKGPEHYREAERLLDYIKDGALQDGVRDLGEDAEQSIATRALAHATLAAAAAHALPTVIEFMGDSPLVAEWGRATGWIVPAEIVDEDWSKTHCLKEHEFGKCGRMKDHDGKCDSEEMPF